jgi:hypothetical protein
MLGEVVAVLLQAQLVLVVLVVEVMERPLGPELRELPILVAVGADQVPIIPRVQQVARGLSSYAYLAFIQLHSRVA